MLGKKNKLDRGLARAVGVCSPVSVSEEREPRGLGLEELGQVRLTGSMRIALNKNLRVLFFGCGVCGRHPK